MAAAGDASEKEAAVVAARDASEKEAAVVAALSLWAQQEMELPPEALPSKHVLHRLCSGPGASIWDFITKHMKHPRTVKKIRGNLLWYQHLEKVETSAQGEEPKTEGEELQGAVSQLRLELQAGAGAMGKAMEAAGQSEAQLDAGFTRLEADHQRGAELRRLGAEAVRIRELLEEGRRLLLPPDREEEAGLGLVFAPDSGLDLEVLREVRAACRIRAQALEKLLEPCPKAQRQQLMKKANQRWLKAAEEVLSCHTPRAVLWALMQLAEESSQEECLGLGPAPEPEAPPTVRSLLQECWGVVGELWGQVSPLPPAGPPLRQLLGEGDPKTLQVARLAVEVAGLEGARRALTRGVQELREDPKAGGGALKSQPPLKELQQRLHRSRREMERRRCLLQALGGATKRLKARLRPLQEQVKASGRVPPGLVLEAERLQQALGQLGAVRELGEPSQGPAPDPLLPVSCILGVAEKSQQGALCQALALRHRLLLGAGLKPAGAAPDGDRNLPLERLAAGDALLDSKLLSRLRLVAARGQARIQNWPRLQALLNQWWEQPAQHVLPPPPSGIPFSHWLQRWTQAAQALAEPQPTPPLPLAEPQPTPLLPLAGAEEEGSEPLSSSGIGQSSDQ